MLGGALVLLGTQHRRYADLGAAMRPAFVRVGINGKPKCQRILPRPRCPAIYTSCSQYPHGFRHLASTSQDDLEYNFAARAESEFVCPFCDKFAVSSLRPARA